MTAKNGLEAHVQPAPMDRSGFQVERTGIEHAERPPDDCLLVILGASGDLAGRELLPSLYELHAQDLLPERFAVLGTALTEWKDETYRNRMREAVREACRCEEERWKDLAPRLFYERADFTAPASEDYARLKKRIEEIREEWGIPDNVLFHLAVPPSFFSVIVHRLDEAGLARSDSTRSDGARSGRSAATERPAANGIHGPHGPSEGGWRRLIIEKPFGRDEASANALDADVREVFDEGQIYRIDHFLGKETVQNMLVFRFGNPGFEPIWNRNYVDHVQITVDEDIGIGRRAKFYEETGVVRDMIQNHLFQLLCMTAIEPPVRFDGAALRDETAKVLEAVRPIAIETDAVRGQYGPGRVDGDRVPGYRQEDGVAEDSSIATFAALKLQLDNWRWADVPFYLRTGKRMNRKLTEVTIHFKPTPHHMFPLGRGGPRGNVLAFRLQPDEGIMRTLAAKQPGPGLSISTVRMDFRYDEAFGVDQPPRAYGWLFLEAMEGDQTLFARSDWIDRAWEIVDPVVHHWESEPPRAFPNYAAGSSGPEAADELLARDGRRWSAL